MKVQLHPFPRVSALRLWLATRAVCSSPFVRRGSVRSIVHLSVKLSRLNAMIIGRGEEKISSTHFTLAGGADSDLIRVIIIAKSEFEDESKVRILPYVNSVGFSCQCHGLVGLQLQVDPRSGEAGR